MTPLPLIGTLSIAASLPPVAMAGAFVIEGGAGLASLPVLIYAVPGIASFVAGLLLFGGRRQGYPWGLASWCLLIAVAAFNLVLSWWPSTLGDVASVAVVVVELLYIAVGVAVVFYLVRRGRNGKSATNGAIAA